MMTDTNSRLSPRRATALGRTAALASSRFSLLAVLALFAPIGCATTPDSTRSDRSEGWDAARHEWLPAKQSFSIVDHVTEWRDLGARLIGGCCRTTPETIRAIRAKLELEL